MQTHLGLDTHTSEVPGPLSRICRCGRPLDCFGHFRAGCSRAGVLGRRGESAVARVCREAGARVSTNVLRDLDVMALFALDARRIEVILKASTMLGRGQGRVRGSDVEKSTFGWRDRWPIL